MKKIGLLLGLSALLISTGVSLGYASKDAVQADAAGSLAYDVDLDIGVNFNTKDASTPGWPESLHWISPNNGNVSQGDSFALRIRNNTAVDIWFTFCPNMEGTLVKPHVAGYTEYTWVNGVQGTTASRTWYLESCLPANFNGWLFLPKSAFTLDKNTNATINQDWTKLAWSYYFIVYGSTDYIDIDLGTIATGNYATGEIVTKLVDWSLREGINGVTEDYQGSLLAKTRNNENLIPTVKFYNAIKDVDACNVAACQTAYNANSAAFATIRNDAANRSYFQNLKIKDYDAGDLLHEGGKYVEYTLAEKWLQIQATATGVSSTNSMLISEETRKYGATALIIAGIIVSLSAAAYFVIKRRKLAK